MFNHYIKMSVNYGMAYNTGVFNASYIPQSVAQKTTTRYDLDNDNENNFSVFRTGTQYNWANAGNFPYNTNDYKNITRTPGNAFNRVYGDAIPQNIKYSRVLQNQNIQGRQVLNY